MFLFAPGVKPSVLFIVPKIFLRPGHRPRRWTEDSTYVLSAKTTRGLLVGEPIVGAYPSVSDVFEMEVVVPWGQKGVVVSRGYNVPLLFVESKVVHEVNKPRRDERTGGVHGRKHLIDNGLNHARLKGRVGLSDFARMRGTCRAKIASI
eukprot:scaffold410_cov125-Isochrysis_galbana.AAC.2